MRRKSKGKKFIKRLLICAVIVIAAVLLLDLYVVYSGGMNIISVEEAAELQDVDCILVLGCGVWHGNEPSPMMKDRLDKALELYELGVSDKLLVSGDHGTTDYNEVRIMKQYCLDAGVPDEDIFMDHAGFSTYESMYRARDVFCAQKIVVVTQQYHLYRATYIGRSLGTEVYGVSAVNTKYSGQTYREVREILARDKDFFKCIISPPPTFLGDAIPIFGSGVLTNDY